MKGKKFLLIHLTIIKPLAFVGHNVKAQEYKDNKEIISAYRSSGSNQEGRHTRVDNYRAQGKCQKEMIK